MSGQDVTAQRFRRVDIHDDTIEKVTVLPALGRRRLTSVEITFHRGWEKRRRLLTISGCRNIRMNIDADILAMNAPFNTAVFSATADDEKLQRFARSFKRHWNVSYEDDPSAAKLAEIGSCILFDIRLFGGTLTFLGTRFKIQPVA